MADRLDRQSPGGRWLQSCPAPHLITGFGPVRETLIADGMFCSPRCGEAAFAAPLFDELMNRIMPGQCGFP